MKILLLIKTLTNKYIPLPVIMVVIAYTVVLMCFPPETPLKYFPPEIFLNEASSFSLLRDSLWFFLLECNEIATQSPISLEVECH
jgi:hypothetical protein